VGAHLTQETKPGHDFVVQVKQLFFRKRIDVDGGHGFGEIVTLWELFGIAKIVRIARIAKSEKPISATETTFQIMASLAFMAIPRFPIQTPPFI